MLLHFATLPPAFDKRSLCCYPPRGCGGALDRTPPPFPTPPHSRPCWRQAPCSLLTGLGWSPAQCTCGTPGRGPTPGDAALRGQIGGEVWSQAHTGTDLVVVPLFGVGSCKVVTTVLLTAMPRLGLPVRNNHTTCVFYRCTLYTHVHLMRSILACPPLLNPTRVACKRFAR